MASIEIKNVGPLADTGQIDLGRFNVIIGKQSTGKSTFMKILCFCQWLEKKIMTGDDKQLIYNYALSPIPKRIKTVPSFSEPLLYTPKPDFLFRRSCYNRIAG